MTSQNEACIIGPGIRIDGRLTGDEDLVIEGRVQGTIALNNHLTVDETGTVVADVEVRELTVRGTVSGNISASDVVSISSEATVVGDVRAPRVIIEDGARFKGNIEMDVPLPDGL